MLWSWWFLSCELPSLSQNLPFPILLLQQVLSQGSLSCRVGYCNITATTKFCAVRSNFQLFRGRWKIIVHWNQFLGAVFCTHFPPSVWDPAQRFQRYQADPTVHTVWAVWNPGVALVVSAVGYQSYTRVLLFLWNSDYALEYSALIRLLACRAYSSVFWAMLWLLWQYKD